MWTSADADEKRKKGDLSVILDLQKASAWKRISAFLFDAILLGIVAVLLAWGLSMALGYNGYTDTVDAAYARYGEMYGIDLNMSLSEYESLNAEQQKVLDEAYMALSQDQEALYAYNMMISLTVVITSVSILLAFLVMEFMIPLFLKNGQTIGKKVFGIALCGTDLVRITPVQLFTRTVIGKYAIETMIPVLIILMILFGTMGIVGPIVIGGLLLLQAVVYFPGGRKQLIHDLPAAVVAVDMASQMIFDTKADLIAYKEKLHAEKVAKQPY